MECLNPAYIAKDDHLYVNQNDKTIVSVDQIFNQIQENVNRVEFKALLDNLSLLCGNLKQLEIVEDNESKNLSFKMFFSSENLREIVQEAIIKRCKTSSCDEWQFISKDNLHGLRLSDLQTALIFGRDQHSLFFIQTILKTLKELLVVPLMSLPNEFFINLCKFLPVKDLNRFSQTNKKAYEFIHSDKSNLVWFNVANDLKIKFSLEKSIEKQVKDPWLEMPFGKINQLTYEIIIKSDYAWPSILAGFDGLFDKILPIFTEHIPKEYYFQFGFQYNSLSNKTIYLIFYRNEYGHPEHRLILSTRVDELTELNTKLSKTLKCCTGKFDKQD